MAAQFFQSSAPTTQSELYVTKLRLEKHPEGGFFAQTYESKHSVLATDSRYNGEERKAGTLIYYLLRSEDYSAWHIIKSDEIWHYYDGSEIMLHMIDPEKNIYSKILLGHSLKSEEASFQVIIPAGIWFAAEVVNKNNSFGLVGCTVNPGFQYKDFNLAKKEDVDSFMKRYPLHAQQILALSPKEIIKELDAELKQHAQQLR